MGGCCSFCVNEEKTPILQGQGPPAGEKHILKPEDMEAIYSFLEPAHLRWRDIGRNLKFTHSELSAIIPSGGLTSPQHYYEKMLSQWLMWAPPDKPFPCTEDMVAALRKVGEHNLALKLEQHTDFMGKDRA